MNSIELRTKSIALNKSICILRIGGCIDVFTANALEQALATAHRAKCYNIVVDLANVDYISSMGWSILLNYIRILREYEGDLKLVNMSEDVYEVYKVLEFHWFLKAYRSLRAAIADFHKPAYSVA
jgi:anti-sigma B factor antagonist